MPKATKNVNKTEDKIERGNCLPAGWAGVMLANVTTHSKEKAEPADFGDRKYIGLEHIESGSNNIIGEGDITSVKSTKAVFRSGDVLYGKLRPYLKKIAQPDFEGVCSTDILVFPQRENLDNGYLLYFLSQNSTAEFATQNANGINLPRISPKALGKINFPLPPKAEQSRIVSAIESLQTRSSRARDLLSEVGPLIGQLRQSVLCSAFSGALTSEWRRQNPNVQPANELLQRIRNERRQRWEAEQLAKYKAEGKKPPQNWQDNYKEPNVAELQSDYDARIAMQDDKQVTEIGIPFNHEIHAPGSWFKFPLLQVVTIVGGSQPPKSIFSATCESGHIRLIQIRDYKSDKHKVFIPKDQARRFCSADDVMIGRYGPPIFQILRGIEGAYNVALMKAVPNEEFISREFLYYYLQSPLIQMFVDADSERTAGQAGVNKKKLAQYPIYLPPLAEQAETVRQVEAALGSIEEIENGLASMESSLTQLDQSILAKAFRGELVPQNPNDEPASELLARIKAARERAEAKKKEAKQKEKGSKSKRATKSQVETVQVSLESVAFDLLLLLQAWDKPVSIWILESALALMQRDDLISKFKKTRSSKRKPKQATTPMMKGMRTEILGSLVGGGAIKPVGDNGYELIDDSHLKNASQERRDRAAAAIAALEHFMERRELDEQQARDAIAAQVGTTYEIKTEVPA